MKKKKGVSLLFVIFIFIVIILLFLIGIYIVKNKTNEVLSYNTSSTEQIDKKIEKNKFSIKMLEENGIGENATLENMKSKFGDLKKDDSYVKTSTGENIDEYSTSGVKLIFANSKLYSCNITTNNFEFNGIKVGDTEDKVLSAFYQEGDEKDVINSEGIIIGQYIYGSYSIEDLDNIKTEEKVEYAYIGNESTASENLYDYIIQYAYMEPPYENEYASEKDKIAYIEFGIKDGMVVSFFSKIIKDE